MPKAPPTYEELRSERAKEWAEAQSVAAKNLGELHARIAQMPDVRQAPSPDTPWSSRGIACVCEGMEFWVNRWVTVNGTRHRAELECCACGVIGTWDCSEKRFL